MITIQAKSAGYQGGDHAHITINGMLVKIGMNENGNQRGLHIAIINPYNGAVDHAQVFDTYTSSEEFDDFICLPLVEGISEGFIVVAACKDDCFSKLSDKAKQWFEQMGSKEIRNLEYRQGFSFIGVAGRTTPEEKRSTNLEESVSVTKMFNINQGPSAAVAKEGGEAENLNMHLRSGNDKVM